MEILIILLILILPIIGWVLFSAFRQKVVIYDYITGVKFTNGRFANKLGPGVHWFNPRVSSIQFVDMRPGFETLNGQEVLSQDGVSLRVSLSAVCNVEDPLLSITATQDRRSAQHLILQSALREVIGNAMIDDLLSKRSEIGERVRESSASALAAIGLKADSVYLRDIMFPGPLKRSFSALVEARKAAEASLERARGEAATLRSLANTARMLDANPNLLQLRLLQSLEQSSGNTIVLNSSGSQLLPLNSPRQAAPPPAASQDPDE